MFNLGPFARKVAKLSDLSPVETETLLKLYLNLRRYQPDRPISLQGDRDPSVFLLRQGWAMSCKTLPNGTRQIVDFILPGDFVGVRSVFLSRSDTSIEPITPIEAYCISKADVDHMVTKTPRLWDAVRHISARDHALIVERLAGLGRRPASERMAHMLLELGSRLMLVELADRSGYDCPLTQHILADATGITPVHVNRVLRELRDAELVAFQDGKVTFIDFHGLRQFCQFDSAIMDES